MSIISMTARKIAVDIPEDPPSAARQADTAAVAAENPGVAALKEIVTYIPSEIVSLYVAWTGVLGALTATKACDADFTSRWWLFVIFLVATPIVVFAVWLLQRPTTPPDNKKVRRPLGEAAVSTIAFAAWAFALPASPFADSCSYDPKYGTPVLLTVLGIFGLFGKRITRNTSAR